jgi:hypothetical protein
MELPGWTGPQDPSESVSRYANGAYLAISQWDVTIDFQLNSPAPGSSMENPKFIPHRAAQIVMSVTHAKVLAAYLAKAITDWEAKFGALPSVEALAPAPQPGGAEDG